MDEQRIRDYLNLIQQLLNSPSGQELEILHTNSLLIDEELVKVIEVVASNVLKENDNTANWLQNLAAELAKTIKHWNQLNQKAVQLYESGDYRQGVSVAEQALNIAQNLWGTRHLDLATSLNNLAVLYVAQGFYLDAESLYQDALAIKKSLLGDEHPDVAITLDTLAQLYYWQGRYSEAELFYKDALAIRKRLLGNQHPDVATTLNNLAELYRLQGRYVKAETLHQEVLEIKKITNHEPCSIANSLHNLSLTYYSQGRYSEAESLLLESLLIWENQLGDQHYNIAIVLDNLAEIYQQQGRYFEAEQYHIKALTMRKELFGDKHPDVATSLNNIAILYRSQGSWLQSEAFFQEVLEMRRCLLGSEHPDVAGSLNNLGGLYYWQRRYSEAEILLIEALAILKYVFGDEHYDIALSLHNLALIYKEQGRYSEAEPLYVKALVMWKRLLGEEHPHVADNLNNLAGLFAATERPTEAMSEMIQSTEIDNTMIRRLFAFSSESDRLSYLKKIRSNLDKFLSLVYNHLSGTPQAIQSALDLILKRKVLTASALAAQNEALYSDRYLHLTEDFHKLRNLSEQIIHLTFSPPQTEDFITYQQQLAQLQAEHNNLQKNLASQVPEIQLQEQLPSRSDVSSELPAGSILIEFVRFDVFNFKAIPAHSEAQWQPARYLAFILPAGEPESVEMIDIGEAEYIDNLIREFRELISGVGKNTESQLGMFSKRPPKLIFRKYHPQAGIKLRQAIFDKLRPYLQGDEHLIIAPDGELNLVPFQILPNDDTGEKMLMDEFTISYLTVGRDIMRQKIETKRPASLKALVFASPNFDLSTESVTPDEAPEQNTLTTNLRECIANKPLKPAVGTNILGERVAQRLKVAPYVENKAIESYFKPLQCPRILLIATHGVFLPNQPEDRSPTFPYQMENGLLQRDRFFGRVENPMLRSALALAGANTWAKGGKLSPEAGKGILFAQDVAGLDLWANEITVLSACETAIGDVAIGEGVFGLRRAFTVAGAKTLIMSLWSVNGWATTLLMERFFDNCEARLGRAAALQEAQNYVRNITVGELQQFELGQEILKYVNNGRELDTAILARQAEDKPLAHPYYWGAWICQGDTTSLPFIACS
ncbi:CHAT domain-containing tetratricopeptide repeat protein [Microcoleus sp. D3_18a_C4]|uniref:CHAT domain-containing tetratricopeptide repeat protein n=1 Tax=Microcoleus sp. D3_18a_C4 TaxID=3055332 RepID=UPI002FD1E5E2